MDVFGDQFGDSAATLTAQLWERLLYRDATQTSIDLSGEQLVLELIAAIRTTGKRFEDPHFPATSESLAAFAPHCLASDSCNIDWKRPFLIGDLSHRPVGRVGNCYFLDSTMRDSSWSTVADLIISEGSEQGLYGVRFFVEGRWKTIVVDDQFPCIKTGGRHIPTLSSSRINHSQANCEKEFWSLILEKAWKKLMSLPVTYNAEETTGPIIGGDASIATGLKASVDLFLRGRDENFLRAVFVEHSTDGIGEAINGSSNLQIALSKLGVTISEEEAETLVISMDVDKSGGIEWEEFKSIAQRPPSKLDQWVANIPLSGLLTSCLQVVVSGEDKLRGISRLDREKLDAVVDAAGEGLKQLLAEAHAQLKQTFYQMDARASQQSSGSDSKFKTFKMSTGYVGNYFEGLFGRIGAPNLKFKQGIEDEHCTLGGFDLEFTTDNYGVTTTPCKEYMISTGQITCDPRDKLDKSGKEVRIINSMEDLKKLELSRNAELREEEILATVLYTGPMYQIYNAILRQHPPNIFNTLKSKNNLFATTIFVLVSAVIKITRVTHIPPGLPLFRGLGGLAELPETFSRADGNGCRGYVEWGFLSTTSHRETAIQYSGVQEGKPLPMVLQTRASSIDRGACIKHLSQYPGEVEYLWPPCSFLEPSGPAQLVVAEGAFLSMLPVRINANGKALTVKELLEQKKSMHLNTFKYMLQELRRELQKIEMNFRKKTSGQAPAPAETDLTTYESGSDSERDFFDSDSDVEVYDLAKPMESEESMKEFLENLQTKCESVLERHKGIDAKIYTNDTEYRALVSEMLDTKSAAISSLKLTLEDPTAAVSYVSSQSLLDGKRQYLGFLERTMHIDDDGRNKAVRFCSALGLMRQKVTKVNGRKVMRNNVDETDEEGLTQLMKSALDGDGIKNVKMLIAAGADINAQDNKGRTPLCLAAEGGHPEIVRVLVHHGADMEHKISYYEDVPLTIAAYYGHSHVVRTLVELGADINARNAKGRTALEIATRLNLSNVIVTINELNEGI